MCDCDIGMCTGDHWGDTVRGSGLLQEEAASVLLAATVPLSRKIPPGNFTTRGRAASALWNITGGISLHPESAKVKLELNLIDEQQKLLPYIDIY